MEADIVIYGATSAGIAAGIQAKRMGHSVVVIEPYEHVGGLTTGGLGQTDIGNKQVIGGIAREFYRGIRDCYGSPEAWVWQKSEEYRDGGQTRTEAHEDTMWTFEPSAAQSVLDQMIQDADLKVFTNHRLERDGGGVTKEGAEIRSIKMESGRVISGKIFIDATYEGTMDAQGHYSNGPRKSFSGGAGLLSTANDYAIFLQMLLNKGEYEGTRILSRKSVELMTVNHLAEGVAFRWDKGTGFGLGFSIIEDLGRRGITGSEGEYGWGGAYHSTYWVDPTEKLVVAYFTQVRPARGLDDHGKLRALVHQAIVD